MRYHPDNPVIVQSDMTVLLETTGPLFEEARDFLGQFAELRKSPEFFHTYAVTPLSVWNAAAAGLRAEDIISGLERLAKYDIPPNVIAAIQDLSKRYGAVWLERDEASGCEVLVFRDAKSAQKVLSDATTGRLIARQISPTRLEVVRGGRGRIKHALVKLGLPVDDRAGYVDGEALPFSLREKTLRGCDFSLRSYQLDAAEIFYAGGSSAGGSGVIVLPCGAGKTIVGIACMHRLQQRTLILTTNITALRQWRREILDKTSLSEADIGEYSGEVKDIRPVTLTTYQILTYKRRKNEDFLHMDLFQRHNWGLIVYDEVHLLPAPVFRAVADIQARRRLGLTATLVREDGREDEVFSLIGPKRYDRPWKELEQQGWIAKALCVEMRIPMPEDFRVEYAMADLREKYRLAMENPNKIKVVERLLERHKDDHVLIIGQYLSQLDQLRQRLGAPIITGETPNDEREALYADFKAGRRKVLIVSKVANFAVDLPDASVAIQVSGMFRSRQEESQRLGRVLRPKAGDNNAYFYSIVSRDTKDQDCARNRCLFLTEQGYRYRIVVLDDEDIEQGRLPFDHAVDPDAELLSAAADDAEIFDEGSEIGAAV
jgi:DNA excision repair protein ERCC-3